MISNKIFIIIFLTLFICAVFAKAECFPDYKCGEWSACVDDLSMRTCVDSKCGADNIIERKFCGSQDCTPDISCGNWGACNYFDKTSDIINEQVIFEGTKERICTDKANCITSFVESEGCTLSVPVKVRRTEWCGEQIVEILNDKDDVVGRVKQTEITKQLRRIDISLTGENLPTYCGYCSDGKQNYDEEDIDCGGPSCPVCVPKINFVDWAYYTSIIAWGIFILMFFVGIIILSRKEGFSEGLKNIIYFFKPLSEEEARAREQKIKELITPKKISSEGFKNYDFI